MEFNDFTELQAFHALHALAQTPYDLTDKNGLSPERIDRCRVSSCGYDLLYATQRIDEQVIDALQALAEEAEIVEKFRAMKSGAVLNTIFGIASEDRQVLHTSCRDIFSQSSAAPEATAQSKEQLERLRAFLADVDNGKITNEQGQRFVSMIQVGIGGSDLGPRALYHALKRYSLPGKTACFIANVDPDDAACVLSRVDLSRALITVVSKSGTTLETLTNEQLVRDRLVRAGLDPRKHLVAVTGAGSPMDDPTRYLTTFQLYDYIGGRYSATSMVGGVMLGFVLGFDGFKEVLRGANDMDVAAEQPELRQNIPLLLAMLGIWNHNFLGHATLAILPYSQALIRFPAHLQQCDMESNGKSVSKRGTPTDWQTGPVVWGEPGTNGQHAFYQLLHQGTEIAPIEFIGFRRSQYERDVTVLSTTSQQKLLANMIAQSVAFARGQHHANPNKFFAGNRPSSLLIGEQLTPYAMGALLALYEHKIAFQGFCWNINSFDQEGVQLGKTMATRILEQWGGSRKEEEKNNCFETAEMYLLQAACVR
jgi:glucose-6-phosphate isomerase